MQPLEIGSSNIVEVQRLRNGTTPITDAVISMTVYDGAGVEVSGATWPVTLTHSADGYYSVTLPSTLVLRRGGTYYGIVDATSGGLTKKWEIQLQAQAEAVY
jgi:hypothetical protein